MASSAEVKYEIQRALLEWGVNPNGNTQHRNFNNEVLQKALSAFQGDSVAIHKKKYKKESKTMATTSNNNNNNNNEAFPNDLKDAIKCVFRAALLEVKDARYFYFLEDYLEEKCQDIHTVVRVKGFPPYFVPRDENWRQVIKSVHYKPKKILKKDFSQWKERDLDPFRRFTKQNTTHEEFMYSQFVDEGFLHGTGFEAITAFHAIYKEPCLTCKYRKSLRWNGGSSTSWQDIVCIVCNSTYEVKSKASEEKIAKEFHYNNVSGGSFSRFHDMHRRNVHGTNTKSTERRKHFLVMISRCPTVKSKGKVWPVHIVEIDTVLPRIPEKAFIPNYGAWSLSSNVRMKQTTKQLWFDIPFSIDVDLAFLARTVFEEVFPGKWEDFSEESYASDNNSEQENEHTEQIPNAEEITNTDDLRLQLENLKFGGNSDDEWDSGLYESD